MIPDRQTLEIGHPRWHVQVTDDGSRTLIDPATRVAFHSGCGAVAETRHVYLGGGGVGDRIAAGRSTAVLEIGLGVGWGLLLTVDAALQRRAKLVYETVEADWLESRFLKPIRFESHLRDGGLAGEFLAWRDSLGESPAVGVHQWNPSPDVTVRVHHARWPVPTRRRFDAIYFDPFDPGTNPGCWTPDVFSDLLDRTAAGGRLATYCVKVRVRTAMEAAGWTVRRVPGPVGGKREVLIATNGLEDKAVG